MPETIQRLFESSAIIAVNKPEGVASIPERSGEGGDLLSLLSAELGERLYVVHRLDKGVTGVILFAKTAAAHKILNDQFAARTVKKTYTALVQGVMKEDSGLFDQPIRKFGSGRMGVDPVRGLPCLTRFKVVERMKAYTLLDLFPESGRRHQNRVHLFNAGHPVVGDRLYGDQRYQKAFERIMLHAREVNFETEPGSRMTISAPLPPSFTSIVERARSLEKPASILPDFVWDKLEKRAKPPERG
jgi:RluA family pseudouridine synthase